MDVKKLVITASNEISKILEKLESDTGMVVDTLRIKDIDITSVGDRRPELSRHIEISMKRLPGTRWG